MIRYEFRKPEGDTAEQMIGLSEVWVRENCSYGMIKNEQGDLCEPLAVALEDDRIIGYLFGHFYEQQKSSSCIPKTSRCFSVDELYVLPEYRGQGIGKRLFRMMEEQVVRSCDYITLSTSTKNYKSILKLYIEELGMCFHSAFLFKKTADKEEKPCE
ncbi:MAG: GNAT family N-acetyltransferase [Oscillospiraceae bacterium]|nr:GNAT family N-acetyltransferase [Oscillospiraceae bacterium]